MYSMDDLMDFVEWLPNNSELFADLDAEAIIAQINDLASSDEGKETLKQLTKQYKSKEMELFKKGGKLDYLLCLKKGGKVQDCGCGKKIEKNQPGGSIASRLWNKFTGKDKYVDGYGQTRPHTPVRESTHRTILKAANSPLVQAIPVVGDIADGYVAADYAVKGNYAPAAAAVVGGLVLPDALEVINKAIPNSANKELVKRVEKMTDNEKEVFFERLNKPARLPSDLDIDKVWIPETPYNEVGRTVIGNTGVSSSIEPWWGWDPIEYQRGGILNKIK